MHLKENFSTYLKIESIQTIELDIALAKPDLSLIFHEAAFPFLKDNTQDGYKENNQNLKHLLYIS